MPHPRPSLIALALLALMTIAGSFIAGYLLMFHSAPAAPALASRPAASAPITTPSTTPITPGLIITKALYGDLPDGTAADVTEKVVAAAEASRKNAAPGTRGAFSIAASNDLFGDPNPGIVKKLRVDYTLDGVPFSRTVEEDATLTIKPGPVRLIIKKALYGDLSDGPATDVTSKLAAAADLDSLTISATNDNFGDPAAGIVKKLRVDYTFDGTPKSKTVGESETLTLSSAGD